MNIICIHCGRSFSITGDQLGKQGKCPHCQESVRLPKAERVQVEHRELTKPSTWMENSMSGLGSLILHVVLLLLLVLIPWGAESPFEGEEGETVMIGELNRQALVQSDSSWDQSAVERDVQPSRQPVLETVQPIQTDSPSLRSASELEIPSVAGGVDQSVHFDAVPSSSAMPSGAQDFGQLVTQLKRDGLDIVLAFDSTGSMDSEIREVKTKIERIGAALFELVPNTRLSICTYRDQGDQYVVKGLPLTQNLSQVSAYLDSISAAGGGDEPEAVDRGLSWSIQENAFRPRARKVILLFGDAPPHPTRQKACLNLAANFRRQQNGIVNTVTCHSDRQMSEFVDIAQAGGGESFLTREDEEIMTQLMVLVFGSAHRDKVIQALNLLSR